MISDATLVLNDWTIDGKGRINGGSSTGVVAAPVFRVPPVQDRIVLLHWAETASHTVNRYCPLRLNVDPSGVR